MFIEIHILQNFAPSNLNRDDTGNPKDTEFGGVRRARISSQCIKRAIRFDPVFARTTAVEPAMRTRWMNRLLKEELVKAGKDETTAQAAADSLVAQYCKLDNKRTSVLLYVSKSEVEQMTRELLAVWDQVVNGPENEKKRAVEQIAKNLFKNLKDRTSAPDIALFGRMLAEKPELNIDAACQVAHAVSTHRVSMDLDFYTAVDDLTADDESGAGMMGVTGFNSACFYRYARIDWEQLVSNLAGDSALAKKTVEGFLRAAIAAIPSGKQNSFAAQNPPDFLLGVLRRDGQSWALTNAFEKPVRAEREGGYLLPSIAALDDYWGRLMNAYGGNDVRPVCLVLDHNAPLNYLKDAVVSKREEWIEALISELE